MSKENTVSVYAYVNEDGDVQVSPEDNSMMVSGGEIVLGEGRNIHDVNILDFNFENPGIDDGDANTLTEFELVLRKKSVKKVSMGVVVEDLD